jgi:hypothetical protein
MAQKKQQSKLDLVTHVRGSKGGPILEVKPYRLHIEGKVRYFEMPAGSGEFYYENGEKVPEANCPKLTPIVRPETEAMKLQKLREQIAQEHAELEKLQAQKASFSSKKEAHASKSG